MAEEVVLMKGNEAIATKRWIRQYSRSRCWDTTPVVLDF